MSDYKCPQCGELINEHIKEALRDCFIEYALVNGKGILE